VALDAHFIHDMLWLQLTLSFHGLNGSGRLRVNLVAGIAVTKIFLMLQVRKGYFPACAAEKVHLFSALVTAIGHSEWQ
jgi:hypothetical protein